MYSRLVFAHTQVENGRCNVLVYYSIEIVWKHLFLTINNMYLDFNMNVQVILINTSSVECLTNVQASSPDL